VGRFCESCRRAGLRPGLYYSLWDRNWPGYEDDRAYAQFLRDQVGELLTDYGPIVELWFDGAWDKDHPTRKWEFDPAWEREPSSGYAPGTRWEWERLYEHIHRLQPDCLVLNNSSSDRPGIPRCFPIDARTSEHLDFVWQGRLLRPSARTEWEDQRGRPVFLPLEVVTSLNRDWYWTKNFYSQPSAAAVADWRRQARKLVGNLLVNTGPTPEGVIPDYAVQTLSEARALMNPPSENH
jgi:alpha-L-fucosidase